MILRTLFVALAAVVVVFAIVLVAWQPTKPALSQDATPVTNGKSGQQAECRIHFVDVPRNIPVGQTATFHWRAWNIDPGTLEVLAPDIAVGRMTSVGTETVTIRGNARGVSEVTVRARCENPQQAGQLIAASAPVVVGGADGSGLDSWPPERRAAGDQEEERPDLEVLHPLVIPDEVEPGGDVRIGVEVHNEGGNPSPATTLKFYRSTNAIISRFDTLLTTQDVPIILQLQKSVHVYNFTAPSSDGTYYYGACVTAVLNEADTTNNCSAAVTLTVESNGTTPPEPTTPAPTPTPPPDAPEKPVVDAFWTDQFTSNGYAKAEFERVADDEDYYDTYYVIQTCPAGGTCSTDTTSAVTQIQDDTPDDCDKFSGDECYETDEILVSYGSLAAGATIRATFYVRSCKTTGPTCSSYDSDSVSYTAPALAPAPTNLATGAVTSSSIALSWDGVQDAARYRVEYRESGTTTWSLKYTSSTSYTVTSLSEETTYQFQVRTRGDGAPYSTTYGSPSAVVTGTTLAARTVYSFTPNPIRLGGTSSVWTVPTGTGTVYIDVDYATGTNKDLAGDILVERLNSSGTVLNTKNIDNEADRGAFAVPDGSRIRIKVEDDAFDVHYSSVTLTFHEGNIVSGDKLATALIQKERRPPTPRNGDDAVSYSGTGSVTLTWEAGTDILGDNPDHYEIEIKRDGSTTTVYSNSSISDALDTTTLVITGTNQWTDGDYTAKVQHCNAAGGCSLSHSIRFTINVPVSSTTPPPATATNTPTPTRPPPPPPAPPPPAPTALYLVVSRTTSGTLTFHYKPSTWSQSTNHYYRVALHHYVPVGPPASAITTKNVTLSSNANIAQSVDIGVVTIGDYGARAQRCRNSNHTNCGSWSALIRMPPRPTLDSLSRHPTDPLQAKLNYTPLTWTNSVNQTGQHQVEIRQQLPGGTWPNNGQIYASTGSPHSFTGLNAGGTYQVKARRCGDATSDYCGYWTDWSQALTLNKLNDPNLKVIPIASDLEGRRARIQWTRVPFATSYEINSFGTVSEVFTPIQDGTTYYHDLNLDDYLIDDVEDTFLVQARRLNTNYAEGSTRVKVIDSPITRTNGDSAGNPTNRGTASVVWGALPTNATERKLVVRKILDESNVSNWNPHNYGIPLNVSANVADGQEQVLSSLDREDVYAVQMTYRDAAGIQVFAGRNAYVWPAIRMPPKDQTVGTFPFFGHWPDRTYTYRICRNTFKDDPNTTGNETELWARLINAAFNRWTTGTGNLIQSSETMIGTDCDIGEVKPDGQLPPELALIPILVYFEPYTTARVNSSVNEIYMVDGDPVSRFHFAGFIHELHGICVFSAPACTISNAYGSDAHAGVRLNVPGNGVDILFNKRDLNPWEKAAFLGAPGSIHFNDCENNSATAGQSVGYPFELVLHETGHAFGLSGFSILELLQGVSLYEQAHPTVAESVMNYDDKVESIDDEPDCSPHPLDIMGMWALYQTLYP